MKTCKMKTMYVGFNIWIPVEVPESFRENEQLECAFKKGLQFVENANLREWEFIDIDYD